MTPSLSGQGAAGQVSAQSLQPGLVEVEIEQIFERDGLRPPIQRGTFSRFGLDRIRAL
jgi:hypothetical protein